MSLQESPKGIMMPSPLFERPHFVQTSLKPPFPFKSGGEKGADQLLRQLGEESYPAQSQRTIDNNTHFVPMPTVFLRPSPCVLLEGKIFKIPGSALKNTGFT